jgi:hypothetical protein
MAEHHRVECDRCGGEEPLRDGNDFDDRRVFNDRNEDSDAPDYSLPTGWEDVSIHHGGVVGHLCPDCWSEFKQFEMAFYRSEPETASIELIKAQAEVSDE